MTISPESLRLFITAHADGRPISQQDIYTVDTSNSGEQPQDIGSLPDRQAISTKEAFQAEKAAEILGTVPGSLR